MKGMSRDKFVMVLVLTSWARCRSFVYRACKSLVDQESDNKGIESRLHDVVGMRLGDTVIWLLECSICADLGIYISAAVRLRHFGVRSWLNAAESCPQCYFRFQHLIIAWLAELSRRVLQTA